MKQLINFPSTFTKFAALLLLLCVFNCQKEDDIQAEAIKTDTQTSSYKIQTIGKDIISKNKTLSERLLAFSSKSKDKNFSVSYRDVYSEAYGFTIETDQAIYIENGQYHSYTFTIYRDEPSNLVENLVFSLQDDGSYKTILMKYSLTEEDINAILDNEETQISYDNKVDWETVDIDLDGLLYKNYQIGNNLYYNSDSGYCYKEIGIISAATGWEDIQQQVVDCPNDLDTEHFSEDDGGGFNTTNNPNADPTDTSNPNEGETANTGNTSNPGNTGNNPPADITTPNISISEQILNCLNSNVDINNPVYVTNADLRSANLNLTDVRDYLAINQCSPEVKEDFLDILASANNNSLVTAFPFVKYPDELAEEYTENYPNFTNFLKEEILKIKDDQEVVNALIQVGVLEEEEIIEALTWGKGPEVRITPLSSNNVMLGKYNPTPLGEDGASFGPNVIEINSYFVDLLEEDLSSDDPQYDIKALKFFIAIVILHEITHYADFNYEGNAYFENDVETGNLFEDNLFHDFTVYGEQVTLTIDNFTSIVQQYFLTKD